MRQGPWLIVVWVWLGLGMVPAPASVALRVPPTALIEGLAIGATTRSYEPLSLFESIDAIRRPGSLIAEIQLGQLLRTNDPVNTVGEGMTDESLAALRGKMAASGMKLVAARVRFSANQSAITRLFEWANRLDIQVLVGEPPRDQFDHVERMIRSFNIGVALPTAAPSGGGGSPGGWSQPKEAMQALRGRDPRFGVVINVLNLVRSGVDPYNAITELRTRLAGIQLSDVSEFSPQARPVPFGTGKFDFRRLLSLLDSQRFDGYIVFDWPAGVPEFKDDLARGVESFRTQMRTIRRDNALRLASMGINTPPGLSYEVLMQGDLPEPVRVLPCPDGGVWIASRRGYLWAWSEQQRTNRLVGRFPVSTTGQRGLYSFEFDPGFLTNGHVYVYRAPLLPQGNSNRVARFTAVNNAGAWSIGLDTEHVLLDIPSSSHGFQQGGGFLLQAGQGQIYIGTGDNNLPEETPRFFDDPKNPPQNLGDLRGKILRIRTDGTVPADNPFVGRTDARPEIFALGLRNPFSLALQETSGRIVVGDVGYNRPRDWEEINLLQAGANYGWPRCDGRNRVTLGDAPCPLPDVVGPWFAYPHDSAAAVVVGPFVEQGPPPGWPERYARGLLYADFARRVIRFARLDAQQFQVTDTIPVASGFAGGPLSLSLTPRGELYLVEYAGYVSGNAQDRLSRLVPRATTSGTGSSPGPGAPPAAAVEARPPP